MNFCWITLKVSNLEKSIEFYNGLLGMKILKRFSPNQEEDIAMLGEEDKPKIELLYDKKNNSKIESDGISIGFEVDSLDKAIKYVKDKNISIKSGPVSPNPRIKFFFIDDPDGITIQLVENKLI